MAEVRPIPALRYDPGQTGGLESVLAPPYDVIDPPLRDRLLARSAHNVVEIDLPLDPQGGDPYRHAAEVIERWLAEGTLIRDRPALWALAQDYTAPGGERHTRHAILARVRVEDYGAGRVRPHERTQPGPKRDRLELTRATGLNLSPIFSLTTRDAWPAIAPATEGPPWAEATDDEGTRSRIWRVAEPAIHEAVATTLADAELLIADGHHRYETARTFAAEIGGEGEHRYTLMALTALADPGLTVFPTHRLLKDLDRPRLEQLRSELDAQFEIAPITAEQLEADPGEDRLPGILGYIGPDGETLRLTLRSPETLNGLLSDRSQAYRELDAVVLETLVLKQLLGMDEDDIAAKRGIGYAKSLAQVHAMLGEGPYQAAFILRSTPVDQVRAVAAAGETMPPKSTYFHPKIPSGLVFNPVAAPAPRS